MQEQIKLTFYVKGRIRHLTELVFDSKEACKEFIDDMQMKDFVVCSDVIINSKEIRRVKIKAVLD